MALAEVHTATPEQASPDSWIGPMALEELNFLAAQVQSPEVPEEEQRNHFERIVSGTYRGIYNLAYRITQDRHLAEDTIQEVYGRIWVNREKFKGLSNYSTWLHRVTVNQSITQITKRARRLRHEVSRDALDEGDGDLGPITMVDFVHDSFEVHSDHTRPIWKALAELNPAERAVVVLRDIQGLPNEEIATILGVKINAAKVRATRARQKLKAILAGHDEDG